MGTFIFQMKHWFSNSFLLLQITDIEVSISPSLKQPGVFRMSYMLQQLHIAKSCLTPTTGLLSKIWTTLRGNIKSQLLLLGYVLVCFIFSSLFFFPLLSFSFLWHVGNMHTLEMLRKQICFLIIFHYTSSHLQLLLVVLTSVLLYVIAKLCCFTLGMMKLFFFIL